MAERGPAYGWDGGNQMLDDLVDQENEQKEKEKREGFSAADELKDLNEDGSDPEAQSPIEAAPPEAPTAPDHIPSAELPLEDGNERLAPDGTKPDDEKPGPGGEIPKGEKPKDDPDEEEYDPIQVGVGSIDKAIDALAREMADQKIIETAHAGSMPKRFARAIWRGTIGREYDRQKYIREAREKIVESGAANLLVNRKEGTIADHQREINSIFERLQEMHIRYGESYEEMADTEANKAFKIGMKELLREYATNPEMSAEAFREGKTRLLAEIQEEHPDFFDGAEQLADNIEAAAEQVRAAAEHAESMDKLLDSIHFYQAEMKHGAVTEVDPTVCDRIIEKINSTKIGKFVSETTVASAVAIAYNGSQMVGARGLGAVMGMVAPGAAGGLVAGMREGAIFRRERGFHLRERAMGADLPEGKRRADMEETRYETIDAVDSAGKLRALLAIEHRSPEQQAELAKAVSEIHSRQVFGDERGADLIGYSSPETAETERLELYRAVAASIKELTEWGATATPEELAAVGAGGNIGDILSSMREAKRLELGEHVDQKDKIYKKLRFKAIGKAVVKGTLIGVAVGTVVQEGVAFASESKQGAIESLVNGGGSSSGEAHKTALASLFGVRTGERAGSVAGYHFERLRNGELVKLSNGTLIKHTENGMDLMQGDKVLVKNIEISKGGTLSESSKVALQEQGVLDVRRLIITHEHKKAVVSTRIGEYISEHPKSTQRVERNLFMDNNTRVFDRNELRLWWGDGGGVDSKGNYVMDITHMEPNGSFHDGLSANARQLAEQGKLKLLISADEAHQHRPFEVPINSDGRAIIDKDSAIAKSLFSKNGGRAISRARFVEVAQTLGESRGREQVNILATLEGKGVGSIRHEVDKIVPEVRTGLVISAPEVVPGGTDYPPIIPVTPRKELEPLEGEPEFAQPPKVTGGYMGGSIEKLREWIKTSDRLKPRSKTTIDGKEVWVEEDGTVVERTLDKEREAIRNYLSKLEAESPEYAEYLRQLEAETSMKVMDSECRVSVIIPAWMEGANIYKLLEEYTKQKGKDGKPLDPSLYEINIIVNRKTGSEPDNSVAEIQRFIESHSSDLKINYVDVEFDPPYNNVGNARKVITDLVLLRSKSRGDSAKPLYIETEDADLVKVSPRTIANVIDKMDKNPHLDAVKGVEDRDPSIMKENDYLFVQRRLWEFAHRMWGAKKNFPGRNPKWNFTWNRVVTGGWNTAYSAEAYALIGGYDPLKEAGEDLDIGERITMIRGDGEMPNVEVVGRVATRSHSSPRRFINEVISGRGAYDGGSFTDEEVNEFIRSASMEELLDRIKPLSRIEAGNQDRFVGLLKGHFEMSKDVMPDLASAQEQFKQLMFWIGLKEGDYRFEGDTVEILSLDNLKQALESYRANPPKAGRS